MPTYDYECGACGHTFELFQSITAKPVRKCPSCAKPRVKRLIGTGGGIIFRGSGFYCTDYRSDSYKSAAKAETGGGSATKSNGDGAKPAGEAAKTSESSSSPSSKSDGARKKDK